MEAKPSVKKYAATVVLATLLSALFVFLGAPFLRVLRNVYGAKVYWLTGLIVMCLFFWPTLLPMAFLIGACWICVGIYSELENIGKASFWAAFISSAVATIFVIVGTLKATQYFGVNLTEEIQGTIDSLLSQKQSTSSSSEELTMISGIKIDTSFILSQIPSIAFVLLFSTIAYGLMMERRTALFLNVRFERIASEIKLLDFKVPDFFIWIGMFSFLGSFIKLNNELATIVASNIFNVMLGIYFFQGLAVFEVALRTFRVGTILRLFLYFVVVFQLFFILSAVGFIDYWANFRKRLNNFRTRIKKQNNGEQI